MKLYIRLKEILKERGMRQIDLYNLLKDNNMEIRQAAISEITNNQRQTINRKHIEKIACVLDITDINELITLKDDK